MNAYGAAGLTDVGGVPEIVGGWLVPPPVVLTVIANGASEALPPLAAGDADDDVLSTCRPFALVGNVATAGTLDLVEHEPRRLDSGSSSASVSPFASVAVATKLYQTPGLAVVGGVPETLGGAIRAAASAAHGDRERRKRRGSDRAVAHADR